MVSLIPRSHWLRIWLRSVWPAFAIGCLLLGASACAPALTSHARLVAGSPAASAIVGSAPASLELTFNEALGPASKVEVIAISSGETVSKDSVVDPANAQRLTAPLGSLAAGVYQVRWHTVPASSGAALNGAYSFTVSPDVRTQPRLSLGKATADSQEAVPLSGQGFAPRSMLKLAIADDAQPLQSVQTDDSGSFATSIVVPPNVPFGWQPVLATDATGARAATPLEVRWGGWPPLDASVVARPGPSSGEVTFSITVRNRSDYVLEAIEVGVPLPEGSSFDSATGGGQLKDGQVTWSLPWIDRSIAGPFDLTLRATAPVSVQAHVDYRHRRPRGCLGDGCLPAFISNAASEPATGSPLGD
jgi:methionine-rich copper-binding protein CopC